MAALTLRGPSALVAAGGRPPAAPAPGGVGQDLRGRRVPELNYPARSLLVVAGVPGAGKTTLLKRLFPRPGVRLLDSEQARVELSPWLGAIPYRYWRPVVHVAHFVRLHRALRGSESIVVHESGTRDWATRLIIGAARRARRRTHLLLLDVDPRDALAGQEARRRTVRRSSFATHVRKWQRLLDAVADPGHRTFRDPFRRPAPGPSGCGPRGRARSAFAGPAFAGPAVRGPSGPGGLIPGGSGGRQHGPAPPDVTSR
jgi:hypothetical protein